MTHYYLVSAAGHISGEIQVPGDKSISHRSIMLGALAEGQTHVTGFLPGEDNLATLRAFQAMGLEIHSLSETEVMIQGRGPQGLNPPQAPLDMGNSGTAMRLLMGVLAGLNIPATLVGDASLSKRPMERVAKPLRQMGAHITTQEGGRPPVVLHKHGGLRGIDYELPMASAQVKSAILLAGLFTGQPTSVIEPAPTRDHTERMLQGFGYPLEEVSLGQGRKKVKIAGKGQLKGRAIQVPGDFSSAAFFIVAGLLSQGEGIRIKNVGLNPTRIGLLSMLERLGAQILVENRQLMGGEEIGDLWIPGGQKLQGYEVPEELIPLAIDEVPIFAVAAAAARGVTTITGAKELRVKESDRIEATCALLRALGVGVEELDDGLIIYGKPSGFQLNGEPVEARGDHRIAMAATVAMIFARENQTLEIRGTEHIRTSFPNFKALMQEMGLPLEEHKA